MVVEINQAEHKRIHGIEVGRGGFVIQGIRLSFDVSSTREKFRITNLQEGKEMKKRFLVRGIIVCLAMVFCVSFSLNAMADIKIGVLAKRGAPKCMKKWGATGAYLTEKLGEK